MLKFLVYDEGEPAGHWPLRNVHLLGSDGNPMRCNASFEEGTIIVEKREAGSAALGLQHPVGKLGEMTLQTCLLPESDEPYILALELARHRLMTLYQKLEDWGMFELSDRHPVAQKVGQSREQFIEALCLQKDEPTRAAQLAQQALETALDGSEELALAHSQLMMNRKRSGGTLADFPVGCGMPVGQHNDRLRATLAEHFDFMQLPTRWKTLAPEEEGGYEWELLDSWVQWASRHRLPVIGGPLVRFEPGELPDWLYIWEHDYDTVRDLVYEHIERLVTRYRDAIRSWHVVSGLHVNRHFPLTFDQIVDLTRMATSQVKQLAPRAQVVVELREPFGEYYSANQRSIPALTYVDLLLQSGIKFDALSLELLMGQAKPGQYVRDLMQLSQVLDLYGSLGKPLQVTFGVPSQPVTREMITASDQASEPVDDNAGQWRKKWSASVQGHWLEAAMQIAVSKPFTEAVAWKDLLDHPAMQLPLAGLLNEDWQPKAAFKRLVNFRKQMGKGEASEDAEAVAAEPEAG